MSESLPTTPDSRSFGVVYATQDALGTYKYHMNI